MNPLDDPHFLQTDWPKGVKAYCSVRQGGVSKAPYDSLNLGNHVQDDPAAVSANRAAYAQHIRSKPVFLNQVHGWNLVELTDQTPDGTAADVCITQTPGLACTIMVADCLPVLFAEPTGQWVAAAHAGWRGLAGEKGVGVMEVAVQNMCARMASPVDQLHVWLGPCIGPQSFEVGQDVKDAFCTFHSDAQLYFRPGQVKGKWWADLPGLARMRLRSMGVKQITGNDGSPAWCTVTRQDLFFSHRRDRCSGRFAASIWRV